MMKSLSAVFLLAAMLFGSLDMLGQLESIMVETYYIADADDATDMDGGHLVPGTRTYRIFADLAQGSKLLAVYGNEQHPVVITSTADFFNHANEGISFGKDLNRNRYSEGTVALDSYLTLGQVSRTFSQEAYMGIPKAHDNDGSVIGGDNNDGGSENIPGGLLKNTSAEMGWPLTSHDGIGVTGLIPGSWIDLGFIDLATSEDTTIFGSRGDKRLFNGTNALLRSSGVKGLDTIENIILIAQLTTNGDIAFELNLEVEQLVEGHLMVVKYVARNEHLGNGVVFHPLLKYPYECGCTDPDYLEASTSFGCTDNSKCRTLIHYGCMDSLACNYDPAANFNIQEICCFIGFCADKDISVVCPDLRPREDEFVPKVSIAPNPSDGTFRIVSDQDWYGGFDYSVIDVAGRLVYSGYQVHPDEAINVRSLSSGFYALILELPQAPVTIPIIIR